MPDSKIEIIPNKPTDPINPKPYVYAGDDLNIPIGSSYQLKPNVKDQNITFGGITEYKWEIINEPVNSGCISGLSNCLLYADTRLAVFIPDVVGIYTLRLTVSDNGKDENGNFIETQSAYDEIIITADVLYYLSGRITYDYAAVLDDITESGIKIDYSNIIMKPARRVRVQAVEYPVPASGDGIIISEVSADDNGNFTLSVPSEKSVTIQVLANIFSGGSQADAYEPNYCIDSVWNMSVFDNTSEGALYILSDSTIYNSTASDINFHAPLEYSGGYVNRTAAPFAILDTSVSLIELMCQGESSIIFPELSINWSPENIAASGLFALGQIGTTHYTKDTQGNSYIYILGKENSDTDEYDDHVIAHEMAHYFEDNLFRTDSYGGPHSLEDVLDLRIAFSEGYATAVAAMAFRDPVYVDTNGSGQNSGFSLESNRAPLGNDKGVYSERSALYFLWSLFENTDAALYSGSFTKIYNVMRFFIRSTYAFESLPVFAAYYNSIYGKTSENLETLWVSDLDTPFDALCAGTCNGNSDTPDIFDVDNDIGVHYAVNRNYYKNDGLLKGAEFWRLYKNLNIAWNANEHDKTVFSNYTYYENKFGMSRWYRYTGKGIDANISVTDLTGYTCGGGDFLDMYVYHKGEMIAFDEEASGLTASCPFITFPAAADETYIITVHGLNTEVSGYNIYTNPQKPGLPFFISADVPEYALPGRKNKFVIKIKSLIDLSNIKINVTGIDDVVIKDRFYKEVNSIKANTLHEQEGMFILPSQKAGYINIHISYVLNNKLFSIVKSFAVKTKNSKFKKSSMGEFKKDAKGSSYIQMKARLLKN